MPKISEREHIATPIVAPHRHCQKRYVLVVRIHEEYHSTTKYHELFSGRRTSCSHL